MNAFIRYIWKEHKRRSAVLVLLGILSSMTSILMNYSLEYAVDCIFHVENRTGYMAVFWFCLMALSTYFSDQFGECYFAEKYRLCFIRDLKSEMIQTFLAKGSWTAEEKKLGKLMNRDSMAEEAGDIYRILAYDLPYCALESIGFLVFLGISVSWKMNVVLLVLLPFAVFLRWVGKELQRRNGEIWEKREESDQFFLDVMEKRDFARANAFVKGLKKIYTQKNQRLLGSQKRLYGISTALSLVQFILENGIRLLVPVFGTFMLYRGEITPGGVAVSTTIFSAFLVPSLFFIMEIYKEIKGGQEAVERVMQAIVPVAAKHRQRENMDENVLLRLHKIGLSFEKHEVLRGLELELPKTGCIGICGASGAGKSTLGKMMAGTYEPSQGKLIYNQRYFGESDVRGQIAYMGADAFFFEGTFLENMGNGERIGEDVRMLLRSEGLSERMELETDAQNISGGQKELLAFARAISKASAKLIILDEPTASLDEKAKRIVIERIRSLSKQKCLVVISHQKEVLAQMDCYYRLRNGRLERYGEGYDGA